MATRNATIDERTGQRARQVSTDWLLRMVEWCQAEGFESTLTDDDLNSLDDEGVNIVCTLGTRRTSPSQVLSVVLVASVCATDNPMVRRFSILGRNFDALRKLLPRSRLRSTLRCRFCGAENVEDDEPRHVRNCEDCGEAVCATCLVNCTDCDQFSCPDCLRAGDGLCPVCVRMAP